MEKELLLEKYKNVVQACKSYYIDSTPTGMTDSEYDRLEIQAAGEGLFIRDWVFNEYLKGTKTKNSFIERIKKTKVEAGRKMTEAMKDLEDTAGQEFYYDLKYDGSSVAIYLDPTTGTPLRIVTVGNLNLDNYGVDQTWKLINHLPKKFPLGIIAIQAEAIIDTTRLTVNPERARQKANGLVNSKYCDSEVSNLLSLKAFRYYPDPSSDVGKVIASLDYRDVLMALGTVKSPLDGHLMFSPATTWTLEELKAMPEGYCETGMTKTPCGTYLNDGWVVYSKIGGQCQGALKFSGAGSDTEMPRTKVLGLKWNSQLSKGKDSWSANVLIDPVVIKGCTITKPSAGSVGKIVKLGISQGAEINIILANSTIPMVGEVFSPGSGNFEWPTCECGYTMSDTDVFGSLLKCGNPKCTARLRRMEDYLRTLSNITEINLNTLLVVDRFKWETTDIDIPKLLRKVTKRDAQGYCDILRGYMKTDLQRRNLDLVIEASWVALTNSMSSNGI